MKNVLVVFFLQWLAVMSAATVAYTLSAVSDFGAIWSGFATGYGYMLGGARTSLTRKQILIGCAGFFISDLSITLLMQTLRTVYMIELVGSLAMFGYMAVAAGRRRMRRQNNPAAAPVRTEPTI